jgi:multisubunit Na+/H+ antiporter MnhC subunit
MRECVVLSGRSQELIEQYINLKKAVESTTIGYCTDSLKDFDDSTAFFRINLPQSHETGLEQFKSPIEYEQLIACLGNDITISSEIHIDIKQEIEFVLASLRAELLRDLLDSMGGDNTSDKIGEENTSGVATLRFIFLALAGTLLAGCEGFDSITTMLVVLSLPSFLILVTGLGFSILSIIVFYSYDLIQVAKNLGVTLRDAPKLLDIYLQQMNAIKSLRKKIDHYKLAKLSTEELLQLQQTLIMLQVRFQSLTEASVQFDKALNSKEMRLAKALISGAAGLLFFGSGFFAGQSVAMFVAAFFTSTVLPTFWPVILFSIIVGVAAFALYLHLEQEGLTKLVSRWFGLDEDKIEQLCDQSKLDKECIKLELLREKIISTTQLTKNLDMLQTKLVPVSENDEKQSEVSVREQPALALKISTNIHSFHPQPRVVQEEFQKEQDSENALAVRDLVCL